MVKRNNNVYNKFIMKVSQIFQKTYSPYLYIKFESGKELRVWADNKNKFGWVERQNYDYTRAGKLGIVQMLNIVKSYSSKTEQKLLPQLKTIFQELEKSAVRLRQKVLNWKTYDLWKEIENHSFKKTGNPSTKALDWYHKTVMVDSDLFLKGALLKQGFLYTFNYDTPKYESVLDFFDTQPLMISFGPIETSLGKRDIGINLHLLPPNIRRIVMYKIFEMYRNLYKDQLFAKNQTTVNVTWKAIAKPLEKYGIGFAIRMYISDLRKNVIQFRYEQWASAIYLPSKRLAKVTQIELERLWAEYVKKQKLDKGPGKNLNESWIKS